MNLTQVLSMLALRYIEAKHVAKDAWLTNLFNNERVMYREQK